MHVEQATKAVEVPDAPAESIVHKTSPYEAEMEALNATAPQDFFDLREVDRRIGVIARFVIEGALRDPVIGRKERADIALRAIQVLEAGRRSELWDDLEKKKLPVTAEAYAEERARVEERLRRLLKVKEKRAAADAALAVVDVEAEEEAS